jgi:hypothetical protein
VSVDPFDPRFFDDPVPAYHWMLEEAPLYWCEPRQLWIMTRQDDVHPLLAEVRSLLQDVDWSAR